MSTLAKQPERSLKGTNVELHLGSQLAVHCDRYDFALSRKLYKLLNSFPMQSGVYEAPIVENMFHIAVSPRLKCSQDCANVCIRGHHNCGPIWRLRSAL